MNKFILYVKTSCPYCVKAEDLLREHGEDVAIIPFDEQDKMLDHMKWAYTHQTVPMVFHMHGPHIQFVGGYTDLVTYLENLDHGKE